MEQPTYLGIDPWPEGEPVSVKLHWFRSYTDHPFDDHLDYEYVATWANGETRECHTLPASWAAVMGKDKARFDATLDKVSQPLPRSAA